MDRAWRHRCQQGKACQDMLKAFLAKRRMGGLFFHCQLAQHLVRAGFEVGRVEKENNHAHVWVLRLRRGQVPIGQEIVWLQKQICIFLKRRGIRYPKKEVAAMTQGDHIKAAFNWEAGLPGWLIFQRSRPLRDMVEHLHPSRPQVHLDSMV